MVEPDKQGLVGLALRQSLQALKTIGQSLITNTGFLGGQDEAVSRQCSLEISDMILWDTACISGRVVKAKRRHAANC